MKVMGPFNLVLYIFIIVLVFAVHLHQFVQVLGVVFELAARAAHAGVHKDFGFFTKGERAFHAVGKQFGQFGAIAHIGFSSLRDEWAGLVVQPVAAKAALQLEPGAVHEDVVFVVGDVAFGADGWRIHVQIFAHEKYA